MYPFTINTTISKESSSANAFENKTIYKVKQMEINDGQKNVGGKFLYNSETKL